MLFLVSLGRLTMVSNKFIRPSSVPISLLPARPLRAATSTYPSEPCDPTTSSPTISQHPTLARRFDPRVKRLTCLKASWEARRFMCSGTLSPFCHGQVGKKVGRRRISTGLNCGSQGLLLTSTRSSNPRKVSLRSSGSWDGRTRTCTVGWNGRSEATSLARSCTTDHELDAKK